MDMTPIAGSAFAGLLERVTGQQLVAGRRWRIEAALGPVMRAAGIESLDRLAVEIGRNQDSPLATTVVEALLNNETSFFRDSASLRGSFEAGLDILLETRAAAGTKSLRIWSAACSTGQEACSLAIFFEQVAARIDGWDIQIIATDISHDAIAKARAGLYNQMEVQRGLPIRELMTHFDQVGDHWRFRRSPRSRISFLQHNLFTAPPVGRFDIILCRNVLLYFVPEKRRLVFDRLATAIMPDGMLMLGAGETVLGSSEAFTADRDLRGVYRKAAIPG